MESRLRRVLLGASAWVVMMVWQLVDLVGRLRNPHLTVDPDRLVLALGCAVCAVPVGSLLGGLLALVGKPPGDTRMAVASTVQTTVCSAAFGLVIALGYTVAPPGSHVRVGLWVSAIGAGLMLGFGLGSAVLTLLREPGLVPEPAPPSQPRWDLSRIEPLP